MMSLKPRNINFQETWANLKETVAGVIALQAVERAVWNTRFSDVYALCVAHPEPLADRLYDETRKLLEEHVSELLEKVRGHDALEDSSHDDGLLSRYVSAWKEFSQGVCYLNNLYSYMNLQHVKRQRASEAEIKYGSSATVSGAHDQDARQLEVGELGLLIWERVLLVPMSSALTSRIVEGLRAARTGALDNRHADLIRAAIHSTVHVQSFRVRNQLALYQQLVLDPYLEEAGAHHSKFAHQLLEQGDISHYMKHVLEGLEREMQLSAKFLHSSSQEQARVAYERAAVRAHLPHLYAETKSLLDKAVFGEEREKRRQDLKHMYALLRPLGSEALKPLVEAAHAQCVRDGTGLLASDAELAAKEPHTHFMNALLTLHGKYSELFNQVFSGDQAFIGALDKACSEVVNSKPSPEAAARAPELVARYCDWLLRRRGSTQEVEDKLSAAIVVFKYLDDKDVFQKYYARALARRLIHQLSGSMDQEENMINRLKAACGYEFTNKLHRMFTDVAVSADLNAKFQQYLRDNNETISTGFFIQVLQAGAWPLGNAMLPLAPPAALERPASLFEAFYRSSFSGRRLAWLHNLCTGELRTRYTTRVYHLTATTPQCALLLSFEKNDKWSVRELHDQLQLTGDAWNRHVKPLVEAGLLTAEGDIDGEKEDADGSLALNFGFTCKRSKLRLTCANAPNQPGGGAGGDEAPAHCDDDRKMYLQAALVRIMKLRKTLRHNELIQEVVSQARGSFAPSVSMIKKCIEALIDKQYLERTPGSLDTYSYVA